MTTFSSTLKTPIGPFTIVAEADGSVLAAGWTGDVEMLLTLVHPDLRRQPRPRPDLGAATKAAIAYHEGDLDAPAHVPVRQQTGGTFLAAAWRALREVPPGNPVTYADLATRTGNPTAVRAAAQACARNAAALFVPCHRVIRTDGSLGGFRWGLDVKRWLIAHESMM